MEIMQIVGNVVSSMVTKTNRNTGKDFGVLSVAVGVGKDTTYFADLIINGGLMPVVEQYASKGRSVYVSGQPNLNPRADGDVVYPNLSLSVNDFQFVDQKGGSRGMMIGTAIGRLVADPETRSTEGGDALSSFRMAVDHGRGDNKVTAFVSAAAFGPMTNVAGYLTKGQKATIAGDVVPRAFQRNNGDIGAELSYRVSNLVLGARPGDDEPVPAEPQATVADGKDDDDRAF